MSKKARNILIGVAGLFVLLIIIGALSSGSSKPKPPPLTPAQLAAQAQTTKLREHQEAVARVANEKREAKVHAAERRAAARKEREEAAQKHREEAKEKAEHAREREREKQEAERKRERETKVLTGSGTQNLGTENVEVESVLTWSNPEGSENNFIISNSPSDEHQITVNALKETSGHTVVEAGEYHHFEVSATGEWTIKIAPK